MKKYYTYTYAYPSEMGGTIFYVGKGSGPRINIHEYEARTEGYNREIHEIIRSIWGAGQRPVKSIVFETDDHQEAIAYEQSLIASLGIENLANRVVNKSAGISPTGLYKKVRMWINPVYKSFVGKAREALREEQKKEFKIMLDEIARTRKGDTFARDIILELQQSARRII